jgi:ribose transport system ATP-binding protein
VLEVVGLAKSYGGVAALRGIDLRIEAGEIHALLGPNGAGKSTLIRCLGGAVAPDAGSLRLQGAELSSLTPRTSRSVGIAIIYQNFSLVDSLSVAENIFLGDEMLAGPFVRKREQRARATELLSLFTHDIRPDELVRNLSVAARQLVEIAKALRHQPRLLVLDEPTASLTEAESRRLGAHLRALKLSGIPILYVTHLLHEVFEVADRVTVLRDGSVVLSGDVENMTKEQIVESILGPVRAAGAARASRLPATGEPLLELRALSGHRVDDITLHVDEGEIVAVFGLLGSGRSELLASIFGVQKRERGHVFLHGERIDPADPADAIAAGIALVPSDRIRQSLFMSLPALDNVLLPSVTGLAIGGALRSRRRESAAFDQVATELRIEPPSPTITPRHLSGGNQQKLAVGRWIGGGQRGRVKLLLLDEPTQGIDVGTRAQLYDLLREFASVGGRGVLLTSSDPEEVLAAADRAIVLARGRVVFDGSTDGLTETRLLDLAHGAEKEAENV